MAHTSQQDYIYDIIDLLNQFRILQFRTIDLTNLKSV